MARRCAISGKQGQHGHRVSHAKNRSKHLFKPNLQTRRLFITDPSLIKENSEEEGGEEKSDKPAGKFVRVKISTRVMRTIDKLGVKATLKKYGLELNDILA